MRREAWETEGRDNIFEAFCCRRESREMGQKRGIRSKESCFNRGNYICELRGKFQQRVKNE